MVVGNRSSLGQLRCKVNCGIHYNIDTGHKVEVNWISPDDDLDDPPYHSEKITISSTTGEKITWFYIDAPTGGLSGERFASGYWIVEIYLDDLFERGHLFYME